MCIPTHTSSLYLHMFVLYLCQFFADYMQNQFYKFEKSVGATCSVYIICVYLRIYMSISFNQYPYPHPHSSSFIYI